MNRLNFKHLTISFLAILLAVTATAQNVYKLNEKNSKLSVSGTSSLQDWEMEATGFSAETGLKLENGAVSEIQYVEFSLPVAKLESDKNTMEKKAHDALQEKKYPQIKFTLRENRATALSGKSAELNGILTIAGKSERIKVPVDFIVSSDREFSASGKVALKMSDFGIEPPTAIFGTIKTDNEVQVRFDFEFNREK